ncbi:MAG: signal peptidase I [Bacteroidales bacterium]|nr:signal peptidase I [Bacteroidales bacterium]MCM1416426.1 signal peptidase I [bacterium]MCM1424043.1 signal peptidase I [bacterium]
MARRKGLTFYQKKKRLDPRLIKDAAELLVGGAVAVFLAFVIVFSVGMRTSVIGDSMEPVLYNGQEILMNRILYRISTPKRGDVIVFLPNGNENSHFYVKRVVGLPGETVQIREGNVYIDGLMLAEDERFDEIVDPGIAQNEIHLSSDEFFVLGDNRNSSEDSRSGNIGAVKKDTIIGKAWFHLAIGEETAGMIE